MDDIVQDFLMETAENLVQLDVDLVALEQDHNNTDLLGSIFRTIHTIKGTCGFIGLPRLEKVAHHGENVLDKFRNGDLDVTPDAITAILHCIDTIKEIMNYLEANGEEPEGDDTEVLNELNRFMADEAGEAEEASEPDSKEPAEKVDEPCQDSEDSGQEEEASSSPEEDPFGFTPTPAPGAVFNEGAETAEAPQDSEETKIEAEPKETKAEVVPAKKEAPKNKPAKPEKSSSLATQNIRVNVELLENLVTSVSELVLARNQLLQIARDSENDEFKVPLQRLNHITSELQEGLMQTRMQPVGAAWSQLPRIVRDLSQDLKKEIDLEMLGADTELDRQVIEVIKDPLMHMVRNSADHGLECPQERLDSGKGRKGQIILKAYHAGGHVVIEISDNGRGLNKERIEEKIITNGLATPEQLEAFSDTQIYNYIFAAGFSTAAAITNVSGRGVGMDVVKSNIEKIGGSVEVTSTPGEGSLFTVKIPLTLAIVSALIIRSGAQRFAIPQVSITELVQASEESEHTVEYVNSHPVLRLRSQLLPLVTLSDVLGISEPKKPQPVIEHKKVEAVNEQEDEEVQELVEIKEEKKGIDFGSSLENIGDDQFIIVAQVGSGQFGIIVDEVYDTEEIVVKPVSPLLRSAKLFAGNTILGDGSVVMILDPKSISDKVGEMHAGANELLQNEKKIDSPDERRMRFLLFKAGDEAPKAVPLALIVRLEEINADDIETSNGAHVLQYRDRLMPLTSVQGFLEFEPGAQKSVLVFQQGHEYIGLVVDEIIDVIEDKLDIKMNTSTGGSYGSMVIAEHTTDLLDIDYFIQQICPNWHSMLDDEMTGSSQQNANHDMTVCFIDHCTLYRNLITPLLELQNIRSLAFEEGGSALAYLEEHAMNVDAFILDKDSLGSEPEEFLRAYKKAFSHVPCFIVGAHFKAEDEVLFSKYECIACLAKNDRDSIITTIRDYLEQARSLAA